MRRILLILSGFLLPVAHLGALLVHGWTIVFAYHASGALGAAVTLLLPGLAELFWGVRLGLESGQWSGFPLLAIGYPLVYIVFIGWIRRAKPTRI